MAIVQSIVALIGRSLGRIVSSLFGWAVVALFGETSQSEKLWLSALVGAAAAWPILVAGAIFPRLASFVVAFAHLPEWVPTWPLRSVWLVLTAAVPLALGIAVAARTRGAATPIPGTAPGNARAQAPKAADSPLRESVAVRLLRGFPITIAVAASFLIVFATVPLRRLMNAIRRRVDLFVPLVTDTAGYDQVAREIADTLSRHGIEVAPAEPPWEVTAPARILLHLGGPSFRGYVPERYARFSGQRLDIVLYPNALYVTGNAADTARAHGLLAEALTAAPAYQTFDPAAQDIERQIRSVWATYRQNPAAHAGARSLLARLDEIARDIGDLSVSYEEWQIVYRQALQLDRALRGKGQLLEVRITAREPGRDEAARGAAAPAASPETRARPLQDLVREIGARAARLGRMHADLAKAEVAADLRSELSAAKGLGAAALAALLGSSALLAAAVLALASRAPAWLIALLLAAVLLAVSAAVAWTSWRRRVVRPLAVTRHTVAETAEWIKQDVAAL